MKKKDIQISVTNNDGTRAKLVLESNHQVSDLISALADFLAFGTASHTSESGEYEIDEVAR